MEILSECALMMFGMIVGTVIPSVLGNVIALLIFILAFNLIRTNCNRSKRKPTIVEWGIMILIILRCILMIFLWWL